MARDDIDARGTGRTPSVVPPVTAEQMAEIRKDLDAYADLINGAIAAQITPIDADVRTSQSDIRESMNAAIGSVDNSLQTVERVPTAAIDRLMNGVEKSLVASEATLGMEGVSVPLMADEMRRDLDDDTGGALIARLQGQDDYWQEAVQVVEPVDPTHPVTDAGGNAPAYTFLPRPGDVVSEPVQLPYFPPPPVSPPDPTWVDELPMPSPEIVPPVSPPAAPPSSGCPPQFPYMLSNGQCGTADGCWPERIRADGGYGPGNIIRIVCPPGSPPPYVPPEPPPVTPPPPPAAPCIPICPPPPCGCSDPKPPAEDDPVSPPPPAAPPVPPPERIPPPVQTLARFDSFLPCPILEDSFAAYGIFLPFPGTQGTDRVSAVSNTVRWMFSIANSAADKVFGQGSSTAKSEALKQNYLLQGDWFGGYSQALSVFDLLDTRSLPYPQQAWSMGTMLGAAHKAQETSGMPLDYLTTSIQYTFQAANPQYIPSQAEADEMYVQMLITYDTWWCWTKMHGNIPTLRSELLKTKFATFTPSEIVALENRGQQWKEAVDDRWARAGIQDSFMRLGYRELGKFVPGPADLVRFMVRDAFDPDVIADGNLGKDFEQKFYGADGRVNPGPAAKWAQAQGMTEDQFRYFWYSHWEYPSNTALYEMMHRLRPDRPEVVAYKLQNPNWNPGDRVNGEQVGPSVITRADAQRIVEINDLAPAMVKPLLDISYHPINRTDGINAFLLGAFTSEQLYHCFRDNGYSADTARTMVGIQEATAARRINNLTGTWSVRRTIKAYQEGSIDRLEANRLLSPLLIDQQKIVRALDDADLEVLVGVRRAKIARVRRAYFTGATDANEALDALNTLSLAPERASQLVATWTEERLGRYREPSAKQVVSWLQFGVINVTDCVKRLRNLGYTEPDIEAMTYQGVLMWSDRTVAKLDKAQSRLDKIKKSMKDQKKETEEELEKRKKEIEKEQKRLEEQRGSIDKELDDRRG